MSLHNSDNTNLALLALRPSLRKMIIGQSIMSVSNSKRKEEEEEEAEKEAEEGEEEGCLLTDIKIYYYNTIVTKIL